MTFTIIKKKRIVPKWKIPWYWIRGRAWWETTTYYDCEITSMEVTGGVGENTALEIKLKGRQEPNIERIDITYKMGY